MTSFAVISAAGEMRAFSVSISVAQLVETFIAFVASGETGQSLRIQEVPSMSKQNLSAFTSQPNASVPRAIEVASAFVILLVAVGFILGILFPGKITGLILPVAFVSWWVLYKEIKKRGL
jgi:hypothetical protein